MKAEDPEASEEIEPQSHHIDLEKLENARYTNEMALHKWQSLIVLENEAGAYRTIPLPYILSKEVQSLASLAESLTSWGMPLVFLTAGDMRKRWLLMGPR